MLMLGQLGSTSGPGGGGYLLTCHDGQPGAEQCVHVQRYGGRAGKPLHDLRGYVVDVRCIFSLASTARKVGAFREACWGRRGPAWFDLIVELAAGCTPPASDEKDYGNR